MYSKFAELLKKAKLKPLRYYIQKRRHTAHNTIPDRDVLKKCKEAERRHGTPPRLFWVGLDMEEPERREYGEEGGGNH